MTQRLYEAAKAVVDRWESGVWVQGWVWVPNPEPEYGKGILNYYECPQCGTTWEDEWDCANHHEQQKGANTQT